MAAPFLQLVLNNGMAVTCPMASVDELSPVALVIAELTVWNKILEVLVFFVFSPLGPRPCEMPKLPPRETKDFGLIGQKTKSKLTTNSLYCVSICPPGD